MAVLYATVMVVAGKSGMTSWLDASLLDAAHSLVHAHTFTLADPPFPTKDLISVKGQFRAGRMPLIQITAAAVYFPLHHLFGLELASEPRDTAVVYRTMALVMSVIPGAGCMLLVYGLGRFWGLSTSRALAAEAVTGFCTLIFPFGTVVGYPILVGMLLLAGVHLLNVEERAAERWWQPRIALAGLVLGLIPSIEPLTGGLVCFLLLVGVTLRRREAIPSLVGGLTAAAVAHVALNLAFTGRPAPFYFYSEFFEYPGSVFTGGTRHHLVRTLPTSFYVWRGTFGGTGFFSLSPITLALTAVALRKWKRSLAPSAYGVFLAIACVACFAVFLVAFPEGGGWSYGPRHLIPWYPFLILWGMLRLPETISTGTRRGLTGLALVSFFFVAVGILEPYSLEGFRRDWRALVPARAVYGGIARHYFPPH